MPALILVVDDSAVVRQALAQILGRAGLPLGLAGPEEGAAGSGPPARALSR